MTKWKSVVVILLAVLTASALPVQAADEDAALDYLKSQQNPDGGFGSGFSPDSTIGSTADALLAIVAIGGDLDGFDQAGNTPLTYLAANAGAATSAGDLAKLILAAIAAGENPRGFGGVDSVAKLESLSSVDGWIGGEFDTFVAHALAVLALSSAQRPIPDAAVGVIRDAQQDNGAWAWDGTSETTSDTNTTAFAVQALIAAGEAADSEAVASALTYYHAVQNEDGGWPYQNPSEFGTGTDANSTALTIQAILATGQDPSGAEWTSQGAKTPLAALEALQNESGAFAWQAAMPDDNLLATVQVLPALAGVPFPFATADVGPAPAVAPVTAPETMPETGGTVLGLGGWLLLTGLALTGSGFVLRRGR